jgi:hypothetical protein
MREPKSLAEWLESQGNPKHSIAEGENGSEAIKEELPEDEYITFKVIEWCDDEDGEYEKCIGVIEAVSEYHARALLRDRISRRAYPKGAWLEYTLDGKKIELDTKGRIPA